MTYFAYNLLTTLAAPLGFGALALSGKCRPLLARFRPPLADPLPQRPIWIQACSVGELNTAKPLVQAIRKRWPDRPVCVSVSTISAWKMLSSSANDFLSTWLPFDHPLCVRRFVRRLQPAVLVLVETELWPNLLRETRRHGAPVVLVNGRLSDKHHDRYVRFRWWLEPVVANLSLACMQNDEYAQRLRNLGVEASRVHVTGNTKFDGVCLSIDEARLTRLREEHGLPPDAPVLVFGSTRPGDEALAAACWQSLRERFPLLHLVVAPRHRERLAEATASFREAILLRSEAIGGRKPAGERVHFIDTVGELVSFYALATVAVIGGSFYPGVNGHNPLESAALGVPTVFGPYMRNFVDPARELVMGDGAVQVQDPEGLCAVLGELLSDPARHARLSKNGRDAVLANQGAINRALDLLETVIADRE